MSQSTEELDEGETLGEEDTCPSQLSTESDDSFIEKEDQTGRKQIKLISTDAKYYREKYGDPPRGSSANSPNFSKSAAGKLVRTNCISGPLYREVEAAAKGLTSLRSTNPAMRSRNWHVVWNNPQKFKPSAKVLEGAILSIPDSTYVVIGKEKGEEGTPHFQTTIVLKNPIGFSGMKKKLAHLDNPHIEECIDVFASIKYCKKDGDFVESGTEPISNKKKGSNEQERWATILAAAREGREEEIPAKIRFAQYRAIEHARQKALEENIPAQTDVQENVWYYGNTGVGKSRKAREDWPEAYLKMCNKWWDGYRNEETVIIEDFDDEHKVLCHHLKIWSDRYKFLGEYKGGARYMRPKRVIVTSNYKPEEIWSKYQDLDPILRRFKVVLIGPERVNMVMGAQQTNL